MREINRWNNEMFDMAWNEVDEITNCAIEVLNTVGNWMAYIEDPENGERAVLDVQKIQVAIDLLEEAKEKSEELEKLEAIARNKED